MIIVKDGSNKQIRIRLSNKIENAIIEYAIKEFKKKFKKIEGVLSITFDLNGIEYVVQRKKF